MKLQLKLDDHHTREVWQAVLRAKAEVAAWPAWKRGEASAPSADEMRVGGEPHDVDRHSRSE